MLPVKIQSSIRCCPVCAEVECEWLNTQQFVLPEGHPLSAGYEVVACARCGMVYADISATQDDYDRFYTLHSKYDNVSTASGGGESPTDARRLRATAEELSHFLPDPHSRVLDVGCATGGLLRFLRELGFDNLHGLDPSPRCAAQAARYGSIYVGSLTSLPDDHGTFDLVILSHILEHVRDVRAALFSIRSLLTIDGQLYLEVPDATRYADYYVTPFHYFDIEHINHFSPSTLALALELAGFTEVAHGNKQTPLTNAIDYPACWVLGKLSLENPRSRTHGDGLVKAIRCYIERSNADFDLKIVKQIERSGQPIIVWGVGCSTTRLLANSPLGQANIQCFVDNDPNTWGQKLQGRDVISPAQLKGRSDPIIITSKLYGEDILRQIRDQLGMLNEVVLLYRKEIDLTFPRNFVFQG